VSERPAEPRDDEPVLPTQTSDDVDSDWRDRERDDSTDADDERYLRERPPHWE
jgi:hypothetical protein